jgi:hypothetical protein
MGILAMTSKIYIVINYSASKKLSKKQNRQNLEKINWRIGENKFEKRSYE